MKKRNSLMAQAMPPQTLFDSVAEDVEMMRLGRKLNQVFAGRLNQRPTNVGQTPMTNARRAAERFLSHFPPVQQRQILRGALVSVYGGKMPASDAVVWLGEDKQMPEQYVSIAHRTIQALREIGILDDLVMTTEGIILYPSSLRE
ncbi:MAG: hypothetical protein KAG66_10950 [Methylococcales bacterium]|nr:hypothetical protein [Methylococcales bacterium]